MSNPGHHGPASPGIGQGAHVTPGGPGTPPPPSPQHDHPLENLTVRRQHHRYADDVAVSPAGSDAHGSGRSPASGGGATSPPSRLPPPPPYPHHGPDSAVLAENERLRGENQRLSDELARVQSVLAAYERQAAGPRRRRHEVRDSLMYTVEDKLDKDGERRTGALEVQPGRLSRQASLGTSNILASKPPRLDPHGLGHAGAGSSSAMLALANRVIDVFKNCLDAPNVEYLSSHLFADDLLELSAGVARIFESERRVLELESPVYVFGDTHGNLEDLHFFADNVWKLGVPLTAGRFLFLGDYVDRGSNSLEVVAYLLALKVQCNTKVFMLRGNHETRDVNGWEDHYAERSFLWQCKDRFGVERGEQVWEHINQVFDRMPLAAVIDNDIFCVHGGVPRRPLGVAKTVSRLELINRVPFCAGINPPNEFETAETQQVAAECIWSDPAMEDQEDTLDADGFGASLRGGGTVCFGNKAIDDFLAEHNFSFICRAHEAHAYGVSLSKMARVFTVFSTSKDHDQGKFAMCGCILVDDVLIQVRRRRGHV